MITASTVTVITKSQMLALLHTHRPFADRFLLHMVARNIRSEDDLVDRLFNSSAVFNKSRSSCAT